LASLPLAFVTLILSSAARLMMALRVRMPVAPAISAAYLRRGGG